MKSTNWNITDGEHVYKIVFEKNKVAIDNAPPVALRKLERNPQPHSIESIYKIPVGGREANLHIGNMGSVVLEMDGFDCKTGEAYIAKKMQAWSWIFIILHIFNFFLLVGGAIGGAITGLAIAMTVTLAGDSSKKLIKRVLACIGVYIGAIIIDIIVIQLLVGMM
jgi:hypothetical protein